MTKDKWFPNAMAQTIYGTFYGFTISAPRGSDAIPETPGGLNGPTGGVPDSEDDRNTAVVTEIRPLPSNSEDLTGKSFDRLTVVGYVGPTRYKGVKRKASSMWLVRCCCGTLENRSGTAVRRAAKIGYAACRECYRLDLLKGTAPVKEAG